MNGAGGPVEIRGKRIEEIATGLPAVLHRLEVAANVTADDDKCQPGPGAAMFRIACWYASLASSTRSAIRHDLRGQCERVRVEPLQVPHDLLAGVDDIRAGTLLGVRLRPLMAQQRT